MNLERARAYGNVKRAGRRAVRFGNETAMIKRVRGRERLEVGMEVLPVS